MPTVVANLELHIADRRSRRPVMAQRASFGELTDYSQSTLQLSRGEEKTIAFDRFIFMHIRDEVTLEVTDEDSNTARYETVSGIFSLPTKGSVKISVDALSTISLERVIHVLYA